ncbi:hypothetical protein MHTCC0001_18100 [Flavobacteriaceae bacterium MHTCC 0001]
MEKLEKDHYYHIYNRGINSQNIFLNEDNMSYFLKLMDKHLSNKIEVIAYCLMNNHFHLVIKIIQDEKVVTQALSNLFNAYSKAFNKQQNRTGSLFEKHFKRKKIVDETYLKNLVLYVHKNPEIHGVVENYVDYEFSSYSSYLAEFHSKLSPQRNYILNLFEDIENFKFAHQSDLQGFKNLAGQENANHNLQDLEDLVGFKKNNQ